MRTVLFTFLPVAVVSLIACGGESSSPQSPAADDVPASRGSGGGNGTSDSKAAPAADDDGGAAADKDAGDKPAQNVDPTCVASCTTSIAPKCGGDATICDEVCTMPADFIACLTAAPSCDKSQWLSCGGGSKKGGSK